MTLNNKCKRGSYHLRLISGEYFDKQEVLPTAKIKKGQSMLSQQLEHFAASPNNPFMEYAKFDGKVIFSLQFWLIIWYYQSIPF